MAEIITVKDGNVREADMDSFIDAHLRQNNPRLMRIVENYRHAASLPSKIVTTCAVAVTFLWIWYAHDVAVHAWDMKQLQTARSRQTATAAAQLSKDDQIADLQQRVAHLERKLAEQQ